jgi:hypothetical protein
MKALHELVFPKRFSKTSAEVNSLIHERIVTPFRPASPPLHAEMRIACIGSCFAEEIAESLVRSGKQTTTLFLSERLNTPFALAHTFAHAFDGVPYPNGYMTDAVTKALPAAMSSSDAFIITLGLSLCWFERGTDRMVFEVPKGHSAKGLAAALDRYEMRQTGVSENVTQISSLIEIVRRHKPSAPIVLTLSPIPLLSVTSGSPIAANIISKSALRMALHEVMLRSSDNVFYWPSYEIVEWYGKYVSHLWGLEDNDMRHLPSNFIDAITKLFVEIYFPSPHASRPENGGPDKPA